MKKNKINILFTFIIAYSLFLGSIYLEAASLITKTTFNKMNESLTIFYNNFDENDKYLTAGPFTCSGDRIRCTGSSSIGTLSKREYEIIGSNSYLSAKNSNNKYWTNNTNGSNAYVVNINSIEEKPQTDSYGIRGAVYVKNETTFSGTGTRIDPYVLNYVTGESQPMGDINLIAFYVDSDSDGSFEDEPNKGKVDKIDQETAYSLVSSVCTDSTGQEFNDMVTYNDRSKSVTINPVQYQISCTIKLSKLKGLIAVAAGFFSSFVMDIEGNMWSWGYNSTGQLGLNLLDHVSQNKPKKIKNYTWRTISLKMNHMLALDSEGYLWSWGSNMYGELGLGSTTDYNSPQKVGNKKWKSISAGHQHSLALDEEDYLWSWGRNAEGQLGNSSTYNQLSPVPITVGTKYTMISSGYKYSLALDKEGYLWSWGSNMYGELGLGSTTNYNSPQKVGNKKWKSIFNGDDHSFAIDEEDYLWSWGYNNYGQLGLGTIINYNSPQKVGDKKWKSIAAGNSHTLAIDKEGYLWSWGENDYGKLGLGTTTNYNSPQKVGNKKWKSIAAGNYHSLGVDEEGNLYSWGRNNYYQLGNETTAEETVPYNLTLNDHN